MERLQKKDPDPGSELTDEIRSDEEELEALAADFGQRRIKRNEWMAARGPIEERLVLNRAKLTKISHRSVLKGFVGTYEDMQRRWRHELNNSQRRAIIAAAVRRIDVAPSNPRKKWDPDRFAFDWLA